MNRTGAQMAPVGTMDVETYARSRLGEGHTDGKASAALHLEYIADADRIGSVPLPGTVKGVATTVMSALKGDKASVLIDKLGERLAFERTGVRLYEALIVKCAAATTPPMIDLKELTAIRNDEEMHFMLVSEVLESLGADPTAMTPCADVMGVASMGFMQVLTDPRTTVSQALNVMLSAELADNASWELLVELARASGHEDIADSFSVAAQTEMRHLAMVKSWLQEAVLAEAT
jgi:rubrerythrin